MKGDALEAVAFVTKPVSFLLVGVSVGRVHFHRPMTPVLTVFAMTAAHAAHVATIHIAVHVFRRAVAVLTRKNNSTETKNDKRHDSNYFLVHPSVPP